MVGVARGVVAVAVGLLVAVAVGLLVAVAVAARGVAVGQQHVVVNATFAVQEPVLSPKPLSWSFTLR